MENIFETNDAFPFDKLSVTSPVVVSGGNYFMKYLVNDSPLYIQPPKCSSRQGITKVAGKRHYADLMFTNENVAFIRWMEHLENWTTKQIFENRDKWFETSLEMHDIEDCFASPLKTYKSGKYYLMRVNIPTRLGKIALQIYDENEKSVEPETISENTQILTILEVQGIRCSARNFQIDAEVKQIMVLKPTNLFEKCIIKPRSTIAAAKDESVPSSDDEDNVKMDIALNQDEENHIVTDPVETNEQEEPEKAVEEPSLESTEEIIIVPTKDLMEEFDVSLDALPETDTVQIKTRNDVYYNMYREAKRKAKDARDLALSAYLEAKHIKKTYMLDDIDSSSDEDEMDLEEDSDQDDKNKDV